MKTSEIKKVALHAPNLKINIARHSEPARSTSTDLGWVLSVNGETWMNHRKGPRVFSSVDFALAEIAKLNPKGSASYSIEIHDTARASKAKAAPQPKQPAADKSSDFEKAIKLAVAKRALQAAEQAQPPATEPTARRVADEFDQTLGLDHGE